VGYSRVVARLQPLCNLTGILPLSAASHTTTVGIQENRNDQNEKHMKKGLMIIILSLIIKSSFGQQFVDLKGDYLGQTPPGDTPVVFAREIVSTVYQEHGTPAFSPDGDEIFWQTNRLDNENQWLISVMTMRRTKDGWTAPEIAPDSSGPVFSPDGNRLYFGSKEKGDDPYFVEKQGNSWGKPIYLGLMARFPELQRAAQLSITSNGTLYFIGYAEGKELWQNFGIYRMELSNGEYAKPALLPPSINAPGGIRNWAPFIAPDESYLIFCSSRELPNDDQGDLFICFRQTDGSWPDPINMGAQINTSQMERFSTVTPDGKYLFFTRDTPGYDEDVYWVRAKIIDRLREKINLKK
jgi:hypothetical protein